MDKTTPQSSNPNLKLWWTLEALSLLAFFAWMLFYITGDKTITPQCFLVFGLLNVATMIIRIHMLYRFREIESFWIKKHRNTPYLNFV